MPTIPCLAHERSLDIAAEGSQRADGAMRLRDAADAVHAEYAPTRPSGDRA